jgi:PAS domain S-box-containing protein
MLDKETILRKPFRAEIDASLRRPAAGVLIVAVLLTIFLGLSSLRNTRLAADEADLIVHTYAVMDILERTSRHLTETEAETLVFALGGSETLLPRFEARQSTIALDEEMLRHLTADNPSQQRRLDVLESQVRAALKLAESTVAKRRQQKVGVGASEFLEARKLMDAASATTQEMKAEENRLLSQRSQRTDAKRQWTSRLLLVGIFTGVGLLILAWLAVDHAISANVRWQTQINTLNAELEERVEQRTLALQSEVSEHKHARERVAEHAVELACSRQELETQTLMLKSVMDGVSEGVVAVDEQGKFVLWNPAAEKIIGLNAANVSSEEWTEHYGLFLPDTVTPFPSDQNPLARAIHGETSTAEMFVHNPALGEGVWIEASATPLKNKNGEARGGVVTFRDVTHSRADEREIRKLNEELEHRVLERTAQLQGANKELESFSYSVSHDLQAPLRHIVGFSKMLVEEFGSTLDPTARHYVDCIQSGTQKMGLLVDELLNLARVGRQVLKRAPTGLNSLVAEVIAILQPESKGRQVEWVIADLPAVECDPALVRQVFQNLLANALKFTGPRKAANSGAGAAEPASALHTIIEVGCKEQDGQSVFMVRDNGVGFNMKYFDRLFGAFQRLHRADEFEGTGIGLATVQRIVNKHGGRVWAQAELDKGAAFYFTLGMGEPVGSKSRGATAGGSL